MAGLPKQSRRFFISSQQISKAAFIQLDLIHWAPPCSWQTSLKEQNEAPGELAASIALAVGYGGQVVDMGLFIGAADSRESEKIHGQHSIGLVVLPPKFSRSRGGSPDGGEKPAPMDTGPTEVGPA